jgi:hypothetical protein
MEAKLHCYAAASNGVCVELNAYLLVPKPYMWWKSHCITSPQTTTMPQRRFIVEIMPGLHRVGKSIRVFVPVVLCMLCVPIFILNAAVSAVKAENTLPYII